MHEIKINDKVKFIQGICVDLEEDALYANREGIYIGNLTKEENEYLFEQGYIYKIKISDDEIICVNDGTVRKY
jgi:hypothetical protein